MPEGMKGSDGKEFAQMQVYTEFDYDKVVELVNTLSRTQASRKLTQLVSDHTSGINACGSGP